MYEQITGEDPYEVPMRIYPAPHYTMGGLWVDYNLMTTIPGLFVLGEANFSDHGANRLGASALMQGLADGYFVIPYTIGDYLATHLGETLSTETDAFRATEAEVEERLDRLLVDQRQAQPPTRSTASSAASSGTTAAWPATPTGCRRRCSSSRRCARSSGATCGSSAAPSSSTRSWRGPAGWPTSSSSPS